MNRENDFHLLESLAKRNKRRRLLKRGLALLSAVVLLFTVNALKRLAVAMEHRPNCEYHYDHIHTDECFDAAGELICGLHEHTDECYQEQVEEVPEELEVDLADIAEEDEADGSEDANADIESVDEADEIYEAEMPADGSYDMNGADQAMLSEILAAADLPVKNEDIQMVGLVDDDNSGDAPVAIALVDQDFAVSATSSFDSVELAIVTADTIYTVKLLNGGAAAPAIEEAEEVDATEDTEEVEIVEESEVTEEAEEAETVEESEVTEEAEEAETVEESEVTEEADADGASGAEEIAEDSEAEKAIEAAEEVEATEEAETIEQAEVTEQAEESEKAEKAEVTEQAEESEKAEKAEVTEQADEAEEAEQAEVTEEAEDKEEAEEAEEAEETEETEETEEAEEADAEDAVDEALYPAQTFEGRAGSVRVNVTAEAGAFPADTTMRVSRVWDRDTLDGIADAVTEDFVEVKKVMAVDIAFFDAEGSEIEPLRPIAVVMTVDEIEEQQEAVVVHMDDEGNAEVVEQSEAPQTGDEKLALNVELPAGEAPVTDEAADEVPAAEEAADETADGTPVDEVAADNADETPADGEAAADETADGTPAADEDAAVEAPAAEEAPAVEEAEPAMEYGEEAAETADETDGAEALEIVEEAVQPEDANETVAFEADAFSVYAVVVTETIDMKYIADDGATYDISVGYGPEALIPAGATLAVKELTGEATEDYLARTEDMLAEGERITLARYFDITILDADGAEVQPAAPVRVSVKLADDDPSVAVQAVHFAEEGEPERIAASREDDEAVAFDARSFSVYGIVYTVDFYYDVDGKTFEYHINGGDVLSLKALLPILKVVEDDPETEQDEVLAFVQNIQSVRFSDESLVRVVPVTEDTTAGAIVDALGVEIEYSAELTDEAIDAIRARVFTAPDWALASLKPFTSHEVLTITLKNGEVVTVKVEDAQDPSTYLGKQIIIYDNGEGRAMTADNWGSDGYRTRFNSIPLSNADSDAKAHWTIESSNGGYYLRSYDGKYLKIDYYNVDLVDSKNNATLLTIQAGSNPDYKIQDKNNSNNALAYCDNREYDGFFSAPNGANNNTSNKQLWLYIREVSGSSNGEGYITVNDWDKGHLVYARVNYYSNLTASQIQWPDGKNKQGIVAIAEPGYAFSHWTVTNTNGYTWNSGLYTKDTIAAGTLEEAALTDRKERFTAVFKPVHQFTVKVASSCVNMGTYGSKYVGVVNNAGVYAAPGQVLTDYGSASAASDDSLFSYGFDTQANDGYEFAFWMYRDQETGLYKGLNAINSGDIVPFNGVTYEAWFTEKGNKLIVYQTNNSAAGSVSKDISHGSEPGATATVNNDNYVFTGWYDQNGHCVSTNPTFDPSLVSKSAVLTAEFAERRSGNVTFKVADGGQGTLRIADSETTSQQTVHMNESGDGKLEQKVVAEPNNGNSFIYWELTRNGNILRLSYESATIDGDSWLTFQDGDTMTAYFSNGTLKDFDASQTAQSDIVITDDKKRELQAWLDSLKKSHTVAPDKTAHVFDYDNRIYQIDITAESSLMDLEADIDLAFIIDVSNSMLFPSKFVKNGQEMILTQDNLNAAYPDGSTHYIISDPTGTSTAYRIFRKADGVWYFVDASLTDDVAHKVTWDCRYSEPTTDVPFRYPMYDAVGSKRRVDYLNESMQSAIDSLHSIMNRVEAAGGTAHDIRVAHSTFAASVYSITPESPFVFEQFQSMKNNENLSIKVRDTGGGTRQDLALRDARDFQWDNTHKKYAILITDGAPVVGSKGSIDGKNITTIRNDIATEATNLKNLYGIQNNVTLITVGLSTQNVLFGSNKLKEIASVGADGQRLYFQAEHADDLESILLDILRMITKQKTVSGEVRDVIDDAFYPVDRNGNPIAAGMYDMNGNHIGDNDMVGQPRYEWRKEGDNWVITYHNLIFNPNETWKGSVLVKAKEDFLGGNTIPTNEEASVKPMWYQKNDGSWEHYEEDAITLPVPHVNVDELSLTHNNSEWTVYLGTEVDPLNELKRLYREIRVNEVVSQTVNHLNKIMTTSGDMLYPLQESDTDGRTQTGAAPETFPLYTVASLSDDDWASLVAGNPVTKPYAAYGHENVGVIVYRVTQEIVAGEDGLPDGPHATKVVGQGVEKYTLTATYIPTAEQHEPEGGWHTTPGRSRGHTTNSMESVNPHIINVFAKGLKLKKMDATMDNVLTGAEFRLYRTARADEMTSEDLMTIGEGQYVPAADAVEVTEEGIADLGHIRRLPEGEQYYLVETQAPTGYVAADPMLLTMIFEETKTYKPRNEETCPYDWTQTANLTLGHPAKRSNNSWQDTSETATPDSETYDIQYRIPNNTGVTLPATGGMGTGIYTLAGAGLVLLAVALMLIRRRQA